jgi:hypothetical protein
MQRVPFSVASLIATSLSILALGPLPRPPRIGALRRAAETREFGE